MNLRVVKKGSFYDGAMCLHCRKTLRSGDEVLTQKYDGSYIRYHAACIFQLLIEYDPIQHVVDSAEENYQRFLEVRQRIIDAGTIK